MPKIPRNSMIERRLAHLREYLKLDTQKLREKTLQRLEDLFDLAHSLAKNGNIKLKQRQIWALIAAYIMCSLRRGFAVGFKQQNSLRPQSIPQQL